MAPTRFLPSSARCRSCVIVMGVGGTWRNAGISPTKVPSDRSHVGSILHDDEGEHMTTDDEAKWRDCTEVVDAPTQAQMAASDLLLGVIASQAQRACSVIPNLTQEAAVAGITGAAAHVLVANGMSDVDAVEFFKSCLECERARIAGGELHVVIEDRDALIARCKSEIVIADGRAS